MSLRDLLASLANPFLKFEFDFWVNLKHFCEFKGEFEFIFEFSTKAN